MNFSNPLKLTIWSRDSRKGSNVFAYSTEASGPPKIEGSLFATFKAQKRGVPFGKLINFPPIFIFFDSFKIEVTPKGSVFNLKTSFKKACGFFSNCFVLFKGSSRTVLTAF